MKLEAFREAIARAQDDDRKPVVALGEFGLIHASTLRYLRGVHAQGGQLFAAVLPIPPSRRSRDLLGDQERVRILEAFEIVSGAALIETPEDLPSEAAHCFYNPAENDLSEQLLETFKTRQSEINALDITDITPTSELLERMATGR